MKKSIDVNNEQKAEEIIRVDQDGKIKDEVKFKPKKNNLTKVLMFLIGGLFLVILGGLIVWFYFNSKDEKQAENTKNLESSPTPIITAKPEENDETSDWKTYRNEKFGFEFKYPKEWLEEEIVSSGMSRFYSEDERNSISFNTGSKGGISGNVTIENYCTSLSKTKNNYDRHDYYIENLKAVYCFNNNDNSFAFMVVHNNKQYELLGKIESLDLLEQILSTFKFIDSENDETADWKTYTNDIYNYEIKYPEEWMIYEQPSSNSFKEKQLIYIGPKTERFGDVSGGGGSLYPNSIYIDSETDMDITKISPNKYMIEEVMFNNLLATKVFRTTEYEVGEPTTDYYLKRDYGLLRITFVNNNLSGDHKPIFDQVLSTFKFIN